MQTARWVLLAACLAGASPGCDRVQAATSSLPAGQSPTVLGGPGNQPGRFVKPRGVAVAADGTVWVMDRSSRLQAFDADGNWLRGWTMRETENGAPSDIEVDRSGNVIVADTHYSRITTYSPQGEVLLDWGIYGKAAGQFIYPVGLAVDAAGDVFVSEYGGNDRVQKFSAKGEFLLAWGALGEGEGQFQRPEDLCVDARGRVWVADSCNHRIQVFDGADGRFLFAWGTVGDEPGSVRYPYDVVVEGDVAYVCEYGNNRVQMLTLEGRSLGTWGCTGREVGQLNFPWDIALDGTGGLWVADTQNHRVQRFRFGEDAR